MDTMELKVWNSTIRSVDAIGADITEYFLVVFGSVVFFMHAGFAFLEAGTIRTKNTTNIVLKNLMDSCIGALVYWGFGFAFAFGGANSFIGADHFFFSYESSAFYAFFFFEFTFAAACTTIISGAMAERTTFIAYMIYSAAVTGFIYPVVSHWVWDKKGWLYNGPGIAMQDFAGSSVVHMTGGTVGLVGAALLGPRIGRYDADGRLKPIDGYTTKSVALGCFILLFGFLAFNGGSALTFSKRGDGVIVSQSVMNTVLSAGAAAVTTLLVNRLIGGCKTWSFLVTVNGALAGAVAICAGCDKSAAWAAVITGAVAGQVYLAWSWMVPRIGIDDPLDAAAVHLGSGFWGVMAAPLFKQDTGVVFKFDRLAWLGFGWNLLGAIVIFSWAAILSIMMFGLLRLLGQLRVPAIEEETGLDISLHGEPAYPPYISNEAAPPDAASNNGINLESPSTDVSGPSGAGKKTEKSRLLDQ